MKEILNRYNSYYHSNTSLGDYYPFGMLMQERSYSSSAYKYGFNGKEKDNEVSGEGNELDFGARIYDSRLGRFLSIDPDIKKYPYFSPYLFAGNNPIRFIDILGRGTGDVFKSIEEAAKDFGKTYNDNSIHDKKEYGSTIIKVTNKFGTYYTYTSPNVGSIAGVSPSTNGLGDGEIVARIHTHANYNPDYDNNYFSPNDQAIAEKKKVLSYVVTPNGSLQKYDPNSKETTTVATDMPSDPTDPDRLNKVDPNALPKDEPTYGVWDWLKDNVLSPIGQGAQAIENKKPLSTQPSQPQSSPSSGTTNNCDDSCIE